MERVQFQQEQASLKRDWYWCFADREHRRCSLSSRTSSRRVCSLRYACCVLESSLGLTYRIARGQADNETAHRV